MFKPKGNFDNSGDFRGKHLRGGWYIYESNRPNLRPVSLLEKIKKEAANKSTWQRDGEIGGEVEGSIQSKLQKLDSKIVTLGIGTMACIRIIPLQIKFLQSEKYKNITEGTGE